VHCYRHTHAPLACCIPLRSVPIPKTMKDAMKSYVAENDLLQELLDEDCDVGAGHEVMALCLVDRKERLCIKQIAR
jgi:hypothetical protein